MGFLRKNLFRLLIVAASLGIADRAFAQTGDGFPISSGDSLLRRVTTPAFGVNLDGTLTTSIASTSLTQALIGRHGYIAFSSSTLGTGVTLTTSIATIPGPAGGRIIFDLVTPASTQIRCDLLTVSGLDWKGSYIPNYTFSQLTKALPHTSSVAFSAITRIRLNNCYQGDNCPGSSCTSVAPPAGSQLRVYTSRFVALPFVVRKQSDILRVCKQTMPISLTVPTSEVCFPGNAFLANVGSTQAVCTDQTTTGCAFRLHPSTNTIQFPITSRVIMSGNSGNFSHSLLDDDKMMVTLRASK